MQQQEIYIDDIEQIKILASKIAQNLSIGDVVTFSGDLGSGKTTLIKYFIEHLSTDSIEVTSPTFNLLHLYKSNNLEIWHFDLYRLKNKIEAYELGIEDAFIYGISLIEWPEVIHDLLPENRLDIKLSFTNKEDSRIVHLSGNSKWTKVINNKLL
jgi:tRNA threonylcarbamoyladenosine biosynthesis protein TsaE